ncbi:MULTISPECIES: hypothetical protein [unclassified Cobetia]|uniref:hypothetical protein n=1 Tax=unclassified Cobetia TaxID=2609414 RepID=UPI00159DFF59|nr:MULTISPECIES: hypothetical protein [unclassified Cobetia]MCO7232456.1 hypothetical protein [Cobetia sp. Dlab-2-AX]MCO7235730.1 hypothetical protein [Cobetia sp. Dlab-2-U]NVN54496.1 hypothetical protein [bacterium Scap17]
MSVQLATADHHATSHLPLDLDAVRDAGSCFGDHHRLPLTPLLRNLYREARREGLVDEHCNARELMSHIALPHDHVVTQEISDRVWRYNVGYSNTGESAEQGDLSAALDSLSERTLDEPLPGALQRLTESWLYLPGELESPRQASADVLWLDKQGRARYRLDQARHWFATLRDEAVDIDGWLAWRLTHLPLTSAPVLDTVSAFTRLARLDHGGQRPIGQLSFVRYREGVRLEGMGTAVIDLPRELPETTTQEDSLVVSRASVERIITRLDGLLGV